MFKIWNSSFALSCHGSLVSVLWQFLCLSLSQGFYILKTTGQVFCKVSLVSSPNAFSWLDRLQVLGRRHISDVPLHLIIHNLLLMILTLITWFSLCLLGFSSVNVTFLSLHTLFFEASQYVQPTLERRKIKPHLLQQGIPKNLQIFCFFVFI